MQDFDHKLLLFKRLLTCLNKFQLHKLVMKVLYKLIIRILIEKILTMLVTAGKIEGKPPHQTFTLRWVNALESVKNVCILSEVHL